MKNKLQLLAEFKDALSNYQISNSTKELLNKVNMLLLVSPTAAGRNTIINELVKSGNYHYIVSDTTRKPRVNNGIGEVNGVEYWFTTEVDFLEGLKNGLYFEAAVIHDQQVSGMSINEIKKAVSECKTAVTDIEVQGVKTILGVKPDTFVVFILPPSFDIWMKRLDSRGEMLKEEKIRRLNSAIVEFNTAINSGSYCFLINDDLPTAISKINQIIDTKLSDQDYQQAGLELAKKLKAETEDYLKNN